MLDNMKKIYIVPSAVYYRLNGEDLLAGPSFKVVESEESSDDDIISFEDEIEANTYTLWDED